MPKLSAGLLLFRHRDAVVEVLIAHPGGPIWSRRDTAAWSLPKGAPLDHETDLYASARREFEEETGHRPPNSPPIDLGEVRMRSGKTVHAWALEGDLDPARLRSLEVEIEWPPRTGRMLVVPEIDRLLWARPAEARRRLNPAQSSFVDRLLAILAARAAVGDPEADEATG
jgi:predicted NUDIX family NTP pyrophosphohydrolase